MPLPDRDELPWEARSIATDRGDVHLRQHLPRGCDAAVVMVGGVGGGFDTPGRDLYPRLAEELAPAGVGAVRVRFRNPRLLEEAEYDLRAGIRALANACVTRLALVGHSFGGAVVIRAAIGPPRSVAVVTLATQSYGTERVHELDCPLLLVHGDADPVLDVSASRDVARRAGPHADIHVVKGGGHDLLDHRDEVRGLVSGWLLERLGHEPLG